MDSNSDFVLSMAGLAIIQVTTGIVRAGGTWCRRRNIALPDISVQSVIPAVSGYLVSYPTILFTGTLEDSTHILQSYYYTKMLKRLEFLQWNGIKPKLPKLLVEVKVLPRILSL